MLENDFAPNKISKFCAICILCLERAKDHTNNNDRCVQKWYLHIMYTIYYLCIIRFVDFSTSINPLNAFFSNMIPHIIVL